MGAPLIHDKRQPCRRCGKAHWIGPDRINGQAVVRCAYCSEYAIWQPPIPITTQPAQASDAKGRPPLPPRGRWRT